MPASTVGPAPSLATFLKSLKQNDIETSVELLISLLKRRQIKNSRPCATATTHLLLRVVAEPKRKWDAAKLIERIRDVGRRLVAAQPRELAVGNIVRRVLGVVREVAERDEDSLTDSEMSGDVTPVIGESRQRSAFPSRISEFSPPHSAAAGRPSTADSANHISGNAPQRPPLLPSSTSYAGQGPPGTSLFNILQHPAGRSPMGTPPTGTQSPATNPSTPRKGGAGAEAAEKLDIKAEVIDGIKELQDELDLVDTQIAEAALDHIHSHEILLTHSASPTVQKFLLAAARKRSFTLFHAEAHPNHHTATHATILHGASPGDDATAADGDERWRPLTSLGITVILIPDTAVFALMSRINKVLLAPHAVLADGSLLAAAGAHTIALAAQTHHVPVVALSGVYQLSPLYPFDTDELIEHGDPGNVVAFADAEFTGGVEVRNPLDDWVEGGLVDLYITNLGGCAPSYLYRIVADHYRGEDVELEARAGETLGKR
ncbi:GCD complex subunit gcd7 [Teratosphaeriaceae sp. CCFEE 6253]|nr:GCD complex subunit gcd7 [Teratosphaeriaceae sp. CCFEE 6253]